MKRLLSEADTEFGYKEFESFSTGLAELRKVCRSVDQLFDDAGRNAWTYLPEVLPLVGSNDEMVVATYWAMIIAYGGGCWPEPCAIQYHTGGCDLLYHTMSNKNVFGWERISTGWRFYMAPGPGRPTGILASFLEKVGKEPSKNYWKGAKFRPESALRVSLEGAGWKICSPSKSK